MALADVQAATEAVQKLRARLPGLLTLTQVERRRTRVAGDKKLAFINETLAVVRTNSAILPPAFNAGDYTKMVRLTSALSELVQGLGQLASDAQDTLRVVCFETLKASQEVYGYVRAAAGRSPSLKVIADRLGERFSRPSRSADAPAPGPAAAIPPAAAATGPLAPPTSTSASPSSAPPSTPGPGNPNEKAA